MTAGFTLAGAFDAGHIRGWTPGWEREVEFHQLEMTGHAEQLEADYALLREEFALHAFRDGAWLARSFPGRGRFDWSFLDRLADVSRGEVTLSLCHYEWPTWANEEDVLAGAVVGEMAEFARQVASRYRGRFAGYIPVVESGYWTAMMTDWNRWWPGGKDAPQRPWWALYQIVGRLLAAIARAVKDADPAATIALSEPWAWHPQLSLEDQGRPFATLLGRGDDVARRELGSDDFGGDESLLDVVGLNFYNNWGEEQGWPLSRLLVEARRQFPGKRIAIGETGNCHFSDCHTVAGWLELVSGQVDAAARDGAVLESVTWAPVLTLGDFDWGEPAPGAWVTWDARDPGRTRHWNRGLAQNVRRFVADLERATPADPRPHTSLAEMKAEPKRDSSS